MKDFFTFLANLAVLLMLYKRRLILVEKLESKKSRKIKTVRKKSEKIKKKSRKIEKILRKS